MDDSFDDSGVAIQRRDFTQPYSQRFFVYIRSHINCCMYQFCILILFNINTYSQNVQVKLKAAVLCANIFVCCRRIPRLNDRSRPEVKKKTSRNLKMFIYRATAVPSSNCKMYTDITTATSVCSPSVLFSCCEPPDLNNQPAGWLDLVLPSAVPAPTIRDVRSLVKCTCTHRTVSGTYQTHNSVWVAFIFISQRLLKFSARAVPPFAPQDVTSPLGLLWGAHIKGDQMFSVKRGEYIGFCVYRRSYLLSPPPVNPI